MNYITSKEVIYRRKALAFHMGELKNPPKIPNSLSNYEKEIYKGYFEREEEYAKVMLEFNQKRSLKND